MIPKRIQGATRWLGAPANWRPDTDGDCGHLAIRTQGDPQRGHGWCESAWEPTPKELEALNNGGSIILRVMGWQPPVALYIEMPVTEEEKPPEPADPGATLTAPDIQASSVCPRCDMAVSPLTLLCQHSFCPFRALKRGEY